MFQDIVHIAEVNSEAIHSFVDNAAACSLNAAT